MMIIKRMKLTGAAILVSRGMKFLQGGPGSLSFSFAGLARSDPWFFVAERTLHRPTWCGNRWHRNRDGRNSTCGFSSLLV
jgi:hypothetical protein